MYSYEIKVIKILLAGLAEFPTLALGRNYIWLNGGGSDQFDNTEIIYAARAMWGFTRGERYTLHGDDRIYFLTLCLDLHLEADKPPN